MNRAITTKLGTKWYTAVIVRTFVKVRFVTVKELERYSIPNTVNG